MFFRESSTSLTKPITVLDIGCGFGGLTMALAELLPEELILAMEIRAKVCEFVRLRIEGISIPILPIDPSYILYCTLF